MELTFSEIKKRDVINITDGKCLGRVTDMKFRFPEGKIVGIIVPGKKTCFIGGLFSKSTLYIPEKNILRIGGDVILVDLSCGNQCAEHVDVGNKGCDDEKKEGKAKCQSHCVPVCPPPCKPNSYEHSRGGEGCEQEEERGFINFDEY